MLKTRRLMGTRGCRRGLCFYLQMFGLCLTVVMSYIVLSRTTSWLVSGTLRVLMEENVLHLKSFRCFACMSSDVHVETFSASEKSNNVSKE